MPTYHREPSSSKKRLESMPSAPFTTIGLLHGPAGFFAVIKVDPRYTSQCCPACGHTEKSNRNKKIHLFTCKNCGYTSNDDRIGAMNLYRMGINYLADSQVPNTVVTE